MTPLDVLLYALAFAASAPLLFIGSIGVAAAISLIRDAWRS